jgi:4'-phosphopantetheinyl transferase
MRTHSSNDAVPDLDPGDVHLWWRATAPDEELPRLRRTRLDVLLRRVLSRYAGLPPQRLQFGREARGRPFLLGTDMPDFNLSDTVGGSVVAVARRSRIGIDLERLDRVPSHRRLARRYFSARECLTLDALDDESARAAFLRLWTAKEASCKSTGTGIYGWLSHWEFDPLRALPRLLALPEAAGALAEWQHVRVSPHPDYTAVIACRGELSRVVGFNLDE